MDPDKYIEELERELAEVSTHRSNLTKTAFKLSAQVDELKAELKKAHEDLAYTQGKLLGTEMALKQLQEKL